MPEAPNPTTPGDSPERKRQRRLLKWSFRTTLVVLALWGLLTQSPLTSYLVMSRVRAAVPGVEVRGSAAIGLGGEIKFRDLELRIPGMTTDAATVLKVKRLLVRPNIRRLLGFAGATGPLVYSAEADQPVVRVSQSVNDGSLNIASLPRTGAAAPGDELFPQIVVRDGSIEIGEHRGTGVAARYDPLRRIALDGLLVNAADRERGAYELSLRQSSPLGKGEREMTLTGRISPRGVSLSLRGLTLGDFPPASIPSRFRESFAFLNLQGNVAQTTFDYDQQSGARVRLELENVAMNLPVQAAVEPLEGPMPDSAPLRMSDLNGWLSFENGRVLAEFKGMLEDLPYSVNVDYKGLTADSPFVCDFVCENFRLEEKPQILRFAPATARYRITQFGNPTGIVTTRARVTRGEQVDGGPGPITIEGTLSFKDGEAAYERFPYRFRNLTGVVQYDDHTINILHVEGDAPSGARIQASAHISPLTDEAKVHVEVKAQDVPLDAVFEEALGASRKRLVTEVCSDRQYDRLVAAGYILSPARAYELRQRLDEARAEFDSATDEAARNAAHATVEELQLALEAPVFSLRGKGDVSLVIDRAEGFEPHWTELIDVRLQKVGVLPDRFPYPIETEGVHVVIDGETVKVGGGVWRGVGGGTVQVDASMVYPTLSDPDVDPMPQVNVSGKGFPADARLYGAIAGAVERENDGSIAPNAGSPSDGVGGWIVHVLTQLGLHGTADVTAQVSSDEYGTSVDARATLVDLTSTPQTLEPNTPFPVIDRITGEVRVNDDLVTLDLGGRLGARDGSGEIGVRAEIDASARDRDFVGPLPDQTWNARVRAPTLDVALPVEHLVRAFAPGVADTLDDLREKFNPAGRLDAAVFLAGGPGETSVASAELSNASGFSLQALGGVIATGSSQGTVEVEAVDSGVLVTAKAVRAPLTVDGEPVGEIGLDGKWGPAVRGEPSLMRLSVKGARFESKVTRRVIQDRVPPDAARAILALEPEGEFDGTFNLRSTDGGETSGELRPRSLAVTLPAGRVAWPQMSGTVEFDGASGVLHGVTGSTTDEGGAWSFGAEGSWIVTETPEGKPRFSLKADLSGRSAGLPKSLLAALPEDLTGVLREMGTTVETGVTLERASITLNHDGSENGRSVNAEGEMRVDGLSIDAGVPVAACNGRLGFVVDRPAGAPAEYEVWSMLDSFRVSNVRMTNGRMRMEGRSGGSVMIPLIAADCHGGRMSGAAEINPLADGGRAYEAQFVFSGVRFAPVLRDQTGFVPPQEVPENSGAASGNDEGADSSRGVMDAQVSLGGIAGDLSTRRGRGSVIVGGGPVVNVPLLLPLIQFSNLQLPMGESLEWAAGSFYIDGPVVAFEEVLVESASVQIYGYGTVLWPETRLDMRFNSRAVRRMPVVSWVLEGLRNELISTRVGGTLGAPDINAVPLAGAGELFGRLFSSGRSEQQQRMDDIERRFQRARERVRFGPSSSTTNARPASGS